MLKIDSIAVTGVITHNTGRAWQSIARENLFLVFCNQLAPSHASNQ